MLTLSSRLLVVTDRHQTNGRPLVPLLQQVMNAVSPAIQLRERDLLARELVTLAHEVQAVTASCGAQLLINDRIDVALAFEGVGVHLRSNSLPVTVARKMVGTQRLLGISAHSVEEAVQGASQGADYIILGPIFETPTKQMYGPPLGIHTLEKACRLVRIPIVGIGGVTAARAREIRRAGAFGAAVITAILGASDRESAARELVDAVTLVP